MSKVMLWGPCPWNRGAYGKNLLNLGLRLIKAGHEVTLLAMTGLQWGRLQYPILECQNQVCHYVTHGKFKEEACPVCQSHDWKTYTLDCLPNNAEDYGQHWLPKWNAIVKPDIVIFHYDIWPLGGYQTPPDIRRMVWYMPIDHSPCPPPVVATLNSAGGTVLSMTRFAQKELQKVDIESTYIPHAVDSKIFLPGNRSEARKRLEFPEDCFLLAYVGTLHTHMFETMST